MTGFVASGMNEDGWLEDDDKRSADWWQRFNYEILTNIVHNMTYRLI